MSKKKDFKKLIRFAKKCNFIMEVGSGLSTIYLAKIALKRKIRMVSIDIEEKEKLKNIKGFEFFKGWSITEKDIIKKGNLFFVDSLDAKKDSNVRNDIIRKIAFGKDIKLPGKKDLIRKILEKSKIPLDFFFCDTGEYCGLAEWNIVKNRIKKEGFFAAHDIFYPKSIKSFQILKDIQKNRNKWKIMYKSICFNSDSQGIVIAKRIK